MSFPKKTDVLHILSFGKMQSFWVTSFHLPFPYHTSYHSYSAKLLLVFVSVHSSLSFIDRYIKNCSFSIKTSSWLSIFSYFFKYIWKYKKSYSHILLMGVGYWTIFRMASHGKVKDYTTKGKKYIFFVIIWLTYVTVSVLIYHHHIINIWYFLNQ